MSRQSAGSSDAAQREQAPRACGRSACGTRQLASPLGHVIGRDDAQRSRGDARDTCALASDRPAGRWRDYWHCRATRR